MSSESETDSRDTETSESYSQESLTVTEEDSEKLDAKHSFKNFTINGKKATQRDSKKSSQKSSSKNSRKNSTKRSKKSSKQNSRKNSTRKSTKNSTRNERRLSSIKPSTPVTTSFKAKIMNIFGVFRTIGSVTAKESVKF